MQSLAGRASITACRTAVARPQVRAMASLADSIRSTVAANKVVVYSKTHCPFCVKAKGALNQFLKPDQYTVIELDQRNDSVSLQDALLEITGGRTVPRVFVGGKFLGGGDDTAAAAASGKLKQLLEECGAL